jgi:hypothetical protein
MGSRQDLTVTLMSFWLKFLQPLTNVAQIAWQTTRRLRFVGGARTQKAMRALLWVDEIRRQSGYLTLNRKPSDIPGSTNAQDRCSAIRRQMKLCVKMNRQIGTLWKTLSKCMMTHFTNKHISVPCELIRPVQRESRKEQNQKRGLVAVPGIEPGLPD